MLEEETRKIHGCDMEKFGTLDSSEKAYAILGSSRSWNGAPSRKGFVFNGQMTKVGNK